MFDTIAFSFNFFASAFNIVYLFSAALYSAQLELCKSKLVHFQNKHILFDMLHMVYILYAIRPNVIYGIYMVCF